MEGEAAVLAERCREILEAHRADDVGLIGPLPRRVVDFFVLATATSEPHLRALRNHLEAELKSPHFIADYQPDSGWCAIDLGSIIVHLFLPSRRRFYGLESALQSDDS